MDIRGHTNVDIRGHSMDICGHSNNEFNCSNPINWILGKMEKTIMRLLKIVKGFVFLGFCNNIVWYLWGFLIIPEWLINDS